MPMPQLIASTPTPTPISAICAVRRSPGLTRTIAFWTTCSIGGAVKVAVMRSFAPELLQCADVVDDRPAVLDRDARRVGRHRVLADGARDHFEVLAVLHVGDAVVLAVLVMEARDRDRPAAADHPVRGVLVAAAAGVAVAD